MYQFSRAMYRELSSLIDPMHGPEVARRVLAACEQTVERMATDREYFARPTRTLFLEVRRFVPMRQQRDALLIISRHVQCAERWLDEQPKQGVDVHGNPLQCRATTRRGTACQRTPLPHNGYCPSHQHLAETEDRVAAEMLAALA